MMESDRRVLREDSHTLLHKILKKIRECERYNIDYDVYLNSDATKMYFMTPGKTPAN